MGHERAAGKKEKGRERGASQQVPHTLAFPLVLLVLSLVFPCAGLYNAAATARHVGLARWQAVAYAQMYQVCDGAPGRDRGVIGQGMTPTTPRLSEEAEEWSPQEVYWILEHGIKMAGMPAFGPTHADDELWEIFAFVERLPTMTPEEYEALTAAPEADGAAASRADDGHDHTH